MTEKSILNEFKEKGISYAIFTYDAGNDSFNEMLFQYYDTNGKELVINEIDFENEIQDLIFDNCQFYEASDGHYIGENGTVTITIEVDDDTNEETFNFEKETLYQYNESINSKIELKLSEEHIDFIEKYVSNINGDSYSDININYKTDFIITPEKEEIIYELTDLIDQTLKYYVPDGYYEINDYYDFNTSDSEDNDLTIFDNKLLIYINNSYTDYRSE